jgi:SAM-dependent methyltransferase
MKQMIKKIPFLSNFARQLLSIAGNKSSTSEAISFPGTHAYWEKRYATGGNSGVGSYDKFAEFKAEVINRFVSEKKVESVIEFGCGDGNQLKLADYPAYLGFDVSETALSLCKQLFLQDKKKAFKLMQEYAREKADLALSLDVIFHLVEDDVFENYMFTLYQAANRFVIIYSSNADNDNLQGGVHVKHRNFTSWVQANIPDWNLIKQIPNKYPYKGDYRTGSFADFFIYERA